VKAISGSTVGGHLRGGWPGGAGRRFRLRQPLWDALRGEARREFVERALRILEHSWPHTYRRRGREAMRALVEQAIVTAAAYGIRGRREVLHFVNWMLAFGEDFDRKPWAQPILINAALDGPTRVSLLLPRARRVLASEFGR
jgi:hypothetical protein